MGTWGEGMRETLVLETSVGQIYALLFVSYFWVHIGIQLQKQKRMLRFCKASKHPNLPSVISNSF